MFRGRRVVIRSKQGEGLFAALLPPNSELLGREATSDSYYSRSQNDQRERNIERKDRGNGTAAAIAHSPLFFNAREPILCAACTTMAVTAA